VEQVDQLGRKGLAGVEILEELAEDNEGCVSAVDEVVVDLAFVRLLSLIHDRDVAGREIADVVLDEGILTSSRCTRDASMPLREV